MSSRPRILIVGAAGQLGRQLKRGFADEGEIIAYDHTTVDLAIPDQVRQMVRRNSPDVILNAAAYTAVDRAESEPEQAMSINALAPGILAEEALRTGALLVHYSTDYVFDGSKSEPWAEADLPNPLNTYGRSKLVGEEAICRVGGRSLIFRTSWVYGPQGSNFLLTMLRLGHERSRLNVVDDQYGAPTTTLELADATRTIVAGVLESQFGSPDDWAGIYHMTCAGYVSWFGFAQAIFTRSRSRLEGKVPTILPIPSLQYPTPARRPQNSILSNEKLRARFGISLAPWEEALDEVLRVLDPPPQPA